MPQCDVGSTTETLVIHFGQERFEQLFSESGTSPLHVRKHRKISVARPPLITSWKQVSVETTEVPSEPITVSRKAKQALHEPIKVSTGTNLAPCQRMNVVREAIKVPCEPTTTTSKAMWVAKSTSPSLDSASCEAKIVSNHKTTSTPHRAKPRLSHEAKAKALCVNNEATTALLISSALLGRTAGCGSTKALSA